MKYLWHMHKAHGSKILIYWGKCSNSSLMSCSRSSRGTLLCPAFYISCAQSLHQLFHGYFFGQNGQSEFSLITFKNNLRCASVTQMAVLFYTHHKCWQMAELPDSEKERQSPVRTKISPQRSEPESKSYLIRGWQGSTKASWCWKKNKQKKTTWW